MSWGQCDPSQFWCLEVTVSSGHLQVFQDSYDPGRTPSVLSPHPSRLKDADCTARVENDWMRVGVAGLRVLVGAWRT